MSGSANPFSVSGQATDGNDPLLISSEHVYPDAPPSYDDIYSNDPKPSPFNIPGDHKIQHSHETDMAQDWHSGSSSSVPSFHSDIERSDSPDPAEDSDDDSVLAQALEFASHSVPSSKILRRLRQPIIIPQGAHGVGKPFSRAYSPQLAAHGINVEEFVEFIDNFNIVSAGSPPLQVLGLIGGIVGMIPYHDAMIVGAGIQTLAMAGNVVVSKVRGAKYIKKANERFFAPRGLKVELVTGDALRARLGLAPDAPLCVPVEVAGDMSVHERRVAALRGHASDDLTFDVPPPNAPSTALEKMCAIQQKKALAKQETKALKGRDRYHEKQQRHGERSERAQRDLDRGVRRLEEKMARADLKKERKMEKILNRDSRRLDRDLERLERKHARKTRRIDRDLAREHRDHSRDQARRDRYLRNDDKEAKTGQKVLWMYVDEL